MRHTIKNQPFIPLNIITWCSFTKHLLSTSLLLSTTFQISFKWHFVTSLIRFVHVWQLEAPQFLGAYQILIDICKSNRRCQKALPLLIRTFVFLLPVKTNRSHSTYTCDSKEKHTNVIRYMKLIVFRVAFDVQLIDSVR